MAQRLASVVELAKIRRARRENAASERPAKILFVDDEERILKAMRALFRLHYDVVTTTSAAEALAMLGQERFTLIVCDQRMPEMQGIDVLRRAREIAPTTVRILLTGFSDLAAIVGSVNEGEVYRYVSKPWENEELEETLADAVMVGTELARVVPPPLPAPPPLPVAPSATPADRSEPPHLPAPPGRNVQQSEQGAVAIHSNSIADAAVPGTNRGDVEIGAAPIRVSLDDEAIAGRLLAAMGANGDAQPVVRPDLPAVLVIEHQQMLAPQLAGLGLEIGSLVSARNATEALDHMQHQAFALVIASIDGADRDNIDFLRQLKLAHPHVLALVATEMGDSDTVIGLVNAVRIYRVILKPIRDGLLSQFMRSALAQAKLYSSEPGWVETQRATTKTLAPSVHPELRAVITERLRSIRSHFRRVRSPA